MKNTLTRPTPWILIIIGFIVFWPIGFVLLFKRLAIDKRATINSGKTLFVVSFVMIAIGLIFFATSFYDGPWAIVFAAIFCGGGILINRIAKRIKNTGERYRKYIALIVNQAQYSINAIALAVGVEYRIAEKDLQKMIDTGYFTGAFIDMFQKTIVLAQPAWVQSAQSGIPHSNMGAEIVVSCKSCGAINRARVGQIADCEYCDSPLRFT